jgi:hypothetical protein
LSEREREERGRGRHNEKKSRREGKSKRRGKEKNERRVYKQQFLVRLESIWSPTRSERCVQAVRRRRKKGGRREQGMKSEQKGEK